VIRSDSDVVEQPKTDDRPLYDALLGGFVYQALLVAHDLKMFPLLSAKPATVSEVSQGLGIDPRPAEALLKLSAALDLQRKRPVATR
jgi:Dimerisation domain